MTKHNTQEVEPLAHLKDSMIYLQTQCSRGGDT